MTSFKGATKYLQVLSVVLVGAKDSEKQDQHHQSFSNNVSEPHTSLAKELGRNNTPHSSCALGLKNEEEGPWADGGSGESADAVARVWSATGVISPSRSLDRLPEVELLSHGSPK